MAGKRVAEWRFPNDKQAKAEETLRRMHGGPPSPATGEPGPDAALPDDYWNAILAGQRAKGRPPLPIEQRRLSEVPRHVLRVDCDKCLRAVEVQTADASGSTARTRSGRTPP